MQAELLVEVTRGEAVESVHFGHIAVVNAAGELIDGRGAPGLPVYPRSAAKMIQALPLVRSGAAAARHLGTEQLALSCASHNGALIHTKPVARWLAALELGDADLRCGPQMPDDRPAREGLIKADEAPCQLHNNCSGKHAGFLTLSKHLGAGTEYHEVDHPVQQAALAAWEEICDEETAGYGIDGCSAPNYRSSVTAMARAMAKFAAAPEGSAEAQLRDAMMAHPELVAGEGRACTELMRAAKGRAAVKTGAEGYFTAIIPGQGLGIALKVADGTTRAAECTMAALLVKYGVLDKDDPAVRKRAWTSETNRRNIEVGEIRPAF
ncbi:asparaginase [Oceanicola sp. 502str15]|uniref:asparaginase n=1 Tax=Oceanicola sp. 502str15 TaxID=2696061 RepID=UPI0020943767|nr:asparaginase [Oceanicola sp. 502str15]MCO6384580.1 asparaginase [Oceanicola sp. 502str15]